MRCRDGEGTLTHTRMGAQRLQPAAPPPPDIEWKDDGMQWKKFCSDVVEQMALNPEMLGQVACVCVCERERERGRERALAATALAQARHRDCARSRGQSRARLAAHKPFRTVPVKARRPRVSFVCLRVCVVALRSGCAVEVCACGCG